VPVSVVICVSPAALLELSVTVRDAPRLPAAVGVKVTAITQLGCGEVVTLAARVAPQPLLEMLKSPGSAPVSATLAIFSTSVPVLVSVMFCAPVAVPMLELPNGTVVGLRDATGMPYPVPLTVADCGDPDALSVTLMVAVRAPPRRGVNFRDVTQS
jgi:hypothetical protein